MKSPEHHTEGGQGREPEDLQDDLAATTWGILAIAVLLAAYAIYTWATAP